MNNMIETMATYFIDIQGFIVNKEFVIKELCLMDASDPLDPFHNVYKMNIPEVLIPIASRKYNETITTNHHLLKWDNGDVTFCPQCIWRSKINLPNSIVYVLDTENGLKMKTLKKHFPSMRLTSYNKSSTDLQEIPKNISCIWKEHHHRHCAYKRCLAMCLDFYKC